MDDTSQVGSASQTADLVSPGKKPIGLRGQKKIEKLKRIKEAAQTLFLDLGYDDTTMRGIARRAGVGLGTLFSYATDKRDLLFLIVNDDFENIARNDRNVMRSDRPVLENLIDLFRLHYGFFMRQPKISRFILRELQFYVDTPEAQRFQRVRHELMLAVADIVDVGQQRGELRKGFDPTRAAGVLFAVYQAELRHWLGVGELELEAAMTRLGDSLGLVLDGLVQRRGG